MGITDGVGKIKKPERDVKDVAYYAEGRCQKCGEFLAGNLKTGKMFCSNYKCIDNTCVANRVCSICGINAQDNHGAFCHNLSCSRRLVDKDSQPGKESDERTMAEGIAQDLKKAFINIIDFGYKSDQAPIVDIITTLIDARIELHAAQMKPINEMGKETEAKPNPYISKQAIQEVVESELEPLPPFIPLTENNSTEIRNGDRFNINGKTCQVRFEKRFIAGLREIEVKPFAGYEPVKPGNPYDELTCNKDSDAS